MPREMIERGQFDNISSYHQSTKVTLQLRSLHQCLKSIFLTNNSHLFTYISISTTFIPLVRYFLFQDFVIKCELSFLNV